MKTISILVLASVLSSQAVGLTDAERAKVAPDVLAQLDAQCAPIERKVIDHRATVRFRCGDHVERVYVFDGSTEVEPQGVAKAKAVGKKVFYGVLAAALTVLVMYTGMAQR
jgi:hypothetical protein